MRPADPGQNEPGQAPPRRRHAQQLAQDAGKRATRELGKQAGKQVRQQATQQLGKRAAKTAATKTGQQVSKHATRELGKQAGKQAGKQVASQAGKQAAIQGTKAGATAAGATASAGITLAVQAGIEVGTRVAKRIGWRKTLLIVSLPTLLASVGLFIITVGVIVSTLATAPANTTTGVGTSVPGIPPLAMDAYNRAAAATPQMARQCTGMTWYILAAVGKVESDHAQGRAIASNGDVTPPFTGPRLDGSGAGGNLTPIHDTDHGTLDGDTEFDRAVGPMQLLPGTWKTEGRDGNSDGKADPHNYYDSALAAAIKLCGTGTIDLNDPAQLRRALLRYNNAGWYADKVMNQATAYADQAQQTGPLPAGGTAGGRAIVAAALSKLGTPYLWGGGDINGPTTGCGHGFCGTGFDCSGLTTYAVYQGSGRRLKIDSYTVTQFNDRRGRHLAWNQMQPGDLMFFDTSERLGHVAIYMGGGKMIHAPQTFDVVKVSPARTRGFAGAVRFL